MEGTNLQIIPISYSGYDIIDVNISCYYNVMFLKDFGIFKKDEEYNCLDVNLEDCVIAAYDDAIEIIKSQEIKIIPIEYKMTQKIIFLKGLPASGKSTWALELCRNRNNFVRLNKDDIREELGNPKWSSAFEEKVLVIQRTRGISALENGESIIIDDTNFSPKHHDFWIKIANEMGVEFEQKYFDVSLEECIQRDKEREKSVGEMVIRSMYNKYVKASKIHTDDRLILKQDITLPKCIICDLDGTLALHNGRNPFDYAKAGTDKLNTQVKRILDAYNYLGVEIIYLSGRDAVARPYTVQWLDDNNCIYRNPQKLYTRVANDSRPDDIVKKELYETYIKDKYFVEFVLDDRDKVVKAWRDLGLLCLQVYYGDF